MKYTAKKTFLHDQLGRVEKGKEFEATPAQVSGVMHLVSKVKPAEKSEPKKSGKAD